MPEDNAMDHARSARESFTAPVMTRRIVDGVSLTESRATVANAHPNPIVMVHGGCHGAWQWASWQSWFAERGWNSTALDWFSHGDSAALPLDEWLRRDIPAVRHEIETAATAASQAAAGAPPIIIAHSMGGLASLAYTASSTPQPAALVLLAPVVPRPFADAPIEIEVGFDRPWGPPPPDVARQLFYSGVDDDTATACYQRLQPESPTAVWQATRWTAEIDVAEVRAHTLVVAAAEDPLTPASYVLALASALGAKHILLPGVGHGVTLDPGWPQLAARIEGWITEAISATR